MSVIAWAVYRNSWKDICDKIDDRMDWLVAYEALCYEIEWYT